MATQLNLNDKTAGKLHEAIVMACLGYYLAGKPIDTQLHTAAHKHNGYVKKQLERIASLGPDGAEKMTDIYLREWDEYKEGLKA